VLYHPHHPTGHNGSRNEVAEALGAIEQHVPRQVALGNAEDDGREEGEDNRCGKMRELHDPLFFLTNSDVVSVHRTDHVQ